MLTHLQSGLLQSIAKLRGSLVEVARRLPLPCSRLQPAVAACPRNLSAAVAHRVELQTDGLLASARPRAIAQPTQAAAATAPEVFKKAAARESSLIILPEVAQALDRLRGRVPRGHVVMEVRMIGHVAGNRGVIAEDFIFDHVLARLHGAEEFAICSAVSS